MQSKQRTTGPSLHTGLFSSQVHQQQAHNTACCPLCGTRDLVCAACHVLCWWCVISAATSAQRNAQAAVLSSGRPIRRAARWRSRLDMQPSSAWGRYVLHGVYIYRARSARKGVYIAANERSRESAAPNDNLRLMTTYANLRVMTTNFCTDLGPRGGPGRSWGKGLCDICTRTLSTGVIRRSSLASLACCYAYLPSPSSLTDVLLAP